VAWIGLYILDGTAIADEAHAPYPDGRPALGIHLSPVRPEPADEGHRVFERLGVVPQAAGASRHGIGRRERPHRHGHLRIAGVVVREHYVVPDADNWIYRLDSSKDGGRSWNEGSIEFIFRRSK
jgi:hypothetical protein